MRPLIRLAVLALLGVMAWTSAAPGVTDYGESAITRLWSPGDDGDQFTCTVSYILPYVNEHIAWVVTAGHCVVDGHGRYIKRTATDSTLSAVNWRAVTLGDPRYTAGFNDLALGTTPEIREGHANRLWLAEKMPDDGMVYIHGFPSGVERVTAAYVIPAKYGKGSGSRFLALKAGEVTGGSSGSPVLDGQGRLVAVLWGIAEESDLKEFDLDDLLKPGTEVALVTPVERLAALMTLLEVKP